MKSQKLGKQVDEILLPFLHATDDSASEHLLQQLIDIYAEPVIREIIRSKLRLAPGRVSLIPDSQEAGDIKGEVTLRVLERLRDFKNDPTEKAISDFRSYVAVAAFHACDGYLRRKYPKRHRLTFKLRYILTHRPDFALWEGANGDRYCGFKAWQGKEKTFSSAPRLQELRGDQQAREQAGLSGQNVRRLELAELVAAVFRWVDGPVKLNHLVQTVSELLGVEELASLSQSFEEAHPDLKDRLADPRVDVAREVDQRIQLQRLWQEICQLPQRQRAALLLNLRDELNRGVIALLPITGICSFREIAAALSTTAEELAEIWNDLPLDDSAIAERLDVTRQQVINLRKSARERLARRMKNFD